MACVATDRKSASGEGVPVLAILVTFMANSVFTGSAARIVIAANATISRQHSGRRLRSSLFLPAGACHSRSPLQDFYASRLRKARSGVARGEAIAPRNRDCALSFTVRTEEGQQ
jgi:hypothetical protein